MSVAATTSHIVQLSATGAAAAAAGVLVGAELTARGMVQLQLDASKRLVWVGRVVGGVAGIAGVIATHRAGSWWLLPALLLWTYGLAAAATCDAATQRIPTQLVRQATVAVAVLVVFAAAGAGHWRWALLAPL